MIFLKAPRIHPNKSHISICKELAEAQHATEIYVRNPARGRGSDVVVRMQQIRMGNEPDHNTDTELPKRKMLFARQVTEGAEASALQRSHWRACVQPGPGVGRIRALRIRMSISHRPRPTITAEMFHHGLLIPFGSSFCTGQASSSRRNSLTQLICVMHARGHCTSPKQFVVDGPKSRYSRSRHLFPRAVEARSPVYHSTLFYPQCSHVLPRSHIEVSHMRLVYELDMS